MWIARDKDGAAFLFKSEPWTDGEGWHGDATMNLGSDSYPHIQYDNSPVEVYIIPANRDLRKKSLQQIRKKITGKL